MTYLAAVKLYCLYAVDLYLLNLNFLNVLGDIIKNSDDDNECIKQIENSLL